MKSGYDQFFKQARQNAASGVGPQINPRASAPRKPAVAAHHTLSERDIDNHLKKRMGMPPKKKPKKISWKLAGLSLIGLIVTSIGFVQHEKVEKAVAAIEINFLGSAQAETPNRAPSAVKPDAATDLTSATKTLDSPEELDHLSKLREKKKELDAREEEINRLDAELQKQKVDLEARLKDLRETREQISKMLEDRVKNDESKVDTLVQMYSNMRPPQAAKVFETLDEDLAIDILGRMKKKSAADIMNLLKPEKAQIFSEKFAGYKRK